MFLGGGPRDRLGANKRFAYTCAGAARAGSPPTFLPPVGLFLLMERVRAAPLAACASAALGFGAVLGALLMSPWFVWSENALSDLGHPRRESALVFGAGLAAAGAVYLVFVWALWAATPRTPAVSAALLALAGGGASLSAVGIVNQAYGAPHLVVSVTYFTLVPVGMLLLALALKAPDPAFRAATLVLALAAGTLGLCVAGAQEYGWPFPSQAVPELLASLVLGGWSVVAAFWAATGRLAAPRSEGPTPQRPPSA